MTDNIDMTLFDELPKLAYSITGDAKKYSVKLGTTDISGNFIDSEPKIEFITDKNILDANELNVVINKLNTQLNTDENSKIFKGGKRSSSKSRKTQLRDEHGRFLPSNKRKMVRRKTARRTMQKSTNPMNTIMTTTLV